jgi:hypothetical protein
MGRPTDAMRRFSAVRLSSPRRIGELGRSQASPIDHSSPSTSRETIKYSKAATGHRGHQAVCCTLGEWLQLATPVG